MVINPYRQITFKNVTILGQYGYTASLYSESIRLLSQGIYPYSSLVTHKFALEDTDDAIRALIDLKCMKAVLVP